jgi:hypothetical protein
MDGGKKRRDGIQEKRRIRYVRDEERERDAKSEE